MICQRLYWPGIRKTVREEVTKCDVCQRNGKQKKYIEFPDKLAEETPWNELWVCLTGLYKLCIKSRDTLILKVVKMMDPVTGWFEIMQFNNNKAITIENLVETTCLF